MQLKFAYSSQSHNRVFSCNVIKFLNPKLKSHQSIRGTEVTTVYNFPAQWRPSFGKQHILNFKVMAVRDIKLRSCLSKNMYLSRDF